MRRTGMSPSFPADLKSVNRMQIMEVFKSGKEYTANDISEQIGLSRQTVMKAVQFFVEKGIIVSNGKGSSTNIGGKRPELFSLASNKYLMCISIWPDGLQFTLMDLRAGVTDQLALQQSLSPDPQVALGKVGNLAAKLLGQNNISHDMLCGVLISTPGIVDYKTNTLKYNALRPEWGINVPVGEILRPYFPAGTPMRVENVAKLTARPWLSEKRVLTVFSSWGGLSGCLMEDGRILHGKNSLIGEFGHMILDPLSEETCGCGGRGCFQRLVSDEYLRKQVAAMIGAHPDSMLNNLRLDELTVRDVFHLSARGDGLARALVAELARTFSVAIRNITLVFDPETVVFHGDYANADDFFQEELFRHLSGFRYYGQRPFSLELDPTPIETLNLRGAYALLLEMFFQDPSLYT